MNCCPYCMNPLGADTESCQCGYTEATYTVPIHHLKPGTILRDKYLVGRALGEGGFGITYIGRDTTLDIRVAIKEYYPHGYSNRNHDHASDVILSRGESGLDFETEMQRFLNEARTMARFSNESGIVSVRDYFRENKTAYIVMEYLDGITLKEYLQNHGKLKPQMLFPLLDPVMVSLSRIHKQGLIHRDISPDNIMLLRDGTLKLLDFGAAREVAGDKSLSVVLKPGYAPEEQYRSKGRQGPWTDVYALCATIYKCITGVTPDESLERVYQDNLLPPSELGVLISDTLESAIMQGLQIRIQDRTQSIDLLRNNLGLAYEKKATEQSFVRNIRISSNIDSDDEKTYYQTQPENKAAIKSPVSSDSEEEEKTIFNNLQGDSVNTSILKKSNRKQRRFSLKIPVVGLLLIILLGIIIIVVRQPKETISQISGDDFYTLTAIGQIKDVNRTLLIHNHLIKEPLADNETFRLRNIYGEEVTDKIFKKATYLGCGLYAAYEASDDVNSAYLFDSTGTDLLNAPVCLIKWPENCSNTDCRYLLVYIAEEETTNTDNFIVCKTEDDVYTSDIAGGQLYQGYIRVYDCANRRFVDHIPRLWNSSEIRICGNSFLIGSFSTGYTLYDSNGTALMDTSGTVQVGNGTLVAYKDGTYRVYDEYGQQTFYANKAIYLIGNSQYIKMQSGDEYTVLDRYGNAVLSDTYPNIYSEVNDVFIVGDDHHRGLITKNGIAFVPYHYEQIYPLANNYFYGRFGDSYTLISPEGIVATDLSYSDATSLVSAQDKKLLVVNKHRFDLAVSDNRYTVLAPALICMESESSGLYGAYDLFTGTQLLSHEYEIICYAAEYLYAYRNGNWEIFEVTFSPGPSVSSPVN